MSGKWIAIGLLISCLFTASVTLYGYLWCDDTVILVGLSLFLLSFISLTIISVVKYRIYKIISKKYIIYILIVIFIAAIIVFIPGYKNKKAVVGVSDAILYSNQELNKIEAILKKGDKLTIQSNFDDCLYVKCQNGKTGWIRCFVICSQKEYKRRIAHNEIPSSVTCVGSEDGKLFLYGGVITIGHNRPVVEPGQAFWMDPTAQNVPFTIDQKTVKGNPSVLYLYKKRNHVVELRIYKKSFDTVKVPSKSKTIDRENAWAYFLLNEDIIPESKRGLIELFVGFISVEENLPNSAEMCILTNAVPISHDIDRITEMLGPYDEKRLIEKDLPYTNYYWDRFFIRTEYNSKKITAFGFQYGFLREILLERKNPKNPYILEKKHKLFEVARKRVE